MSRDHIDYFGYTWQHSMLVARQPRPYTFHVSIGGGQYNPSMFLYNDHSHIGYVLYIVLYFNSKIINLS